MLRQAHSVSASPYSHRPPLHHITPCTYAKTRRYASTFRAEVWRLFESNRLLCCFFSDCAWKPHHLVCPTLRVLLLQVVFVACLIRKSCWTISEPRTLTLQLGPHLCRCTTSFVKPRAPHTPGNNLALLRGEQVLILMIPQLNSTALTCPA